MKKELLKGTMVAGFFFAFMIIGIHIIVNSNSEYPLELVGPITLVAVSLFAIFIIVLQFIVKNVRKKKKKQVKDYE